MISQELWNKINYSTRLKLAEIFHLTRSHIITVVNGMNGGEITHDGFTAEDLAGITVEKLRHYLNPSNEIIDKPLSINELLELAVKKVEQPIEIKQHVQLHQQKTETERTTTEDGKGNGTPVIAKKRRGRPKKQTGNGTSIASII